MAATARDEKRLLTEAEFQAVAQTHHPALAGLEREALTDLARRLRDYRDKAQDVTARRRRARRGKAEPSGAGPAPDEAGTARKAGVLAQAVRRLNKEVERRRAAVQAPSQASIARRALAMKRAAERVHHPRPGRTPGRGMRDLPNDRDAVRVDPREVGRVSQQVKAAQARRDG